MYEPFTYMMTSSNFPGCWPFVRGIHRSSLDSPHKGQWRGVLVFSFICAWTNGWVNNRDTCDLRRHCAHYDITVIGVMLSTGIVLTRNLDIVVFVVSLDINGFVAGALWLTWMTEIPAWIGHYIHYKNKITYSFPPERVLNPFNIDCALIFVYALKQMETRSGRLHA